jgi:hypothetical protein
MVKGVWLDTGDLMDIFVTRGRLTIPQSHLMYLTSCCHLCGDFLSQHIVTVGALTLVPHLTLLLSTYFDTPLF